MQTLFISDLHLSARRPKTSEIFLKFLETEAKLAEALYILGDFFEAWLGDDVADPHQALIMHALARLSEHGTKVYVMTGNRDFLIGKTFAKQSLSTLLNDPTTIQLYGNHIVLTHGDKLCTLDKQYQRFRRIIQHPWMKKFLANLPLFCRKKIAKILREKPPGYTVPPKIRPAHWDVVFEDVCQILEDHNANIIIHGHTHQPKIQEFLLKEKSYKHIILGEWDNTGSVLKITPDTIELKTIL